MVVPRCRPGSLLTERRQAQEGVEVLSGFGLLRERLQRFWDDNVVDFG